MLLLRNENGVDHVDDAVAALDVSLDDLGLVDHDALLVVDRDRLAANGLDLGAVGELHNVSGQNLAWDDMVGEDGNQLGLVLWLQEGRSDAGLRLLELGECLIGWGKYCERASTLEGVDQAGSLDRCDESLESWRAYCGVDDVFGLSERRHADQEQ